MSDRRDDSRDRQALGPWLSRHFDQGARRRDRRALRPDRRRAQRVRPERLRPPSGLERPHRPGRVATSRSATSARRWTSASRSRRRAAATRGLCLNLGVGFNLNLPIFKRLSLGPLDQRLAKEASAADRQIRDVQIKTAARSRAGLEPLGRQSAEGRDRQMAQSRRQALHLRRADGRRRRRHQGGNLSPARLAAAERAPASS